MPYSNKQYNSAIAFLPAADDNVISENDKIRIQAYDLFENIYLNSVRDLKIVIRGEDQSPLLMPSGRKIIEATNRFLGIGFDYFVEPGGDEGTRQNLDTYLKDFWKREAVNQKFASNKRWGLIRGDAVFMIYADSEKEPGKRVSIKEIDPRQIFEIEDEQQNVIGIHLVDIVQDFRTQDTAKRIARRRTFRKTDQGTISSELTFWELGKWDDRETTTFDPNSRVRGQYDEDVFDLPASITELPTYKWRNNPPQNSTWGISQLAGLETLMYGINQALTDEDATVVFQGLGMYVTNAKPPIDPTTGDITDWNIGPMQIIEIGQDQEFTRVTGITDLTPYQSHMDYMDSKGLQEAAGTPALAIGKVDVNTVASGIALKMELMPLLAANKEKELELITVLDQMLYDLAVMWLPAYETEIFNVAGMTDISVVCLFDDPMPVDRDAKIQETLLLVTSNLILTSMAVSKLRELGWEYPSVDINGVALTDDDIAAMLSEQTAANATNAMGGAQQGFGGEQGFGSDQGFGQDQNQGGGPQEIDLNQFQPNGNNGATVG